MADFSPVFLRKNPYIAVWSVSHRLGSFGRIHLFAGVLFHKKDQKRDGGIGIWKSPFGPFVKWTSATLLTRPHTMGRSHLLRCQPGRPANA